TGSYVAGKVGLETLTGASVTVVNTSGSANTVVFTGLKDGVQTTVTKTAASVKSLFGLRSIYFRVNEQYGGPVDPPTFNDTAGSGHEANIEWAAAQGITPGCNPPANTSFCPEQPVTRGQMAAFLRRTLGLPAASMDYFSDDSGNIFEGDINAIAEVGITSGCDGGPSFCPDDPVTRGEMAAFLNRAYGLAASSVDYFNDDDTSIFEQDINRLRLAGITLGCNPPTNDNFCPDDPVTRAQMATFLHRAVDG
ncbi:MAG TPA: S-layer homology domain-containing protein, partial [Actinobacteria bacterium]|nr:S-layer homology domain-containing protein [Actinomycetota bacterium]